MRRHRIIDDTPAEVVIVDEDEPCPYLEGRTARLPLRLPLRRLTRIETDERLAQGDRRYGRMLYRTTCPSCRSCEPLRVPVESFVPSRSQRRVLARGDRELRTEIGAPIMTPERLALYDRHRVGRGLAKDSDPVLDEAMFSAFFVDSSVDTLEFRFYLDDAFIGFAVADRGANAISAVYCAFDPACSRLSVGTYSILKHIEFARAERLTYVYLGLYIAENQHVNYKARFMPHERLVDGKWHLHDRTRETDTRSRWV
jgi:arginyl-tRNA--protein-N-Asp/Glu arginylyltransferase